jgi:signal transduction histidine kinase
MILARLNVRQKLTLLLILPLIAVVITSVPFTIGQVSSAVAAGSTVGVASQAQVVGVLVQDLQEERLLALTYLATPQTDQTAYVTRTAATDDHAADVEQALVLPRDVKLKSAVGGLRALTNVRRSVLRRTVAPASVLDTYHDTVIRFIDALRLTQQDKADATGIRQMNILDALLRTNEETGRVGAGLVFASTDPVGATNMVKEAELLRASVASRFRQQADAEENTLLNLVLQGPTGRRVSTLAKELTEKGTRPSLTESLSAAQTIITLTRMQQERIARDIAIRADERASTARVTAGVIIGVAGLLVGIVILLSMAVSRSVSRPLRRLTAAAVHVAELATAELVRVADSEIENAQPPKVEAVEVQTEDEIGELAVAFNRVQLTAARLMEQQIATRRNTSVMFANIARRTRSMVARQLTFIDDLERNEQNERLLAKLYRLDHLTTRLHRSADSLLVVSGAREDERIVAPAPLSEVIRSAVAEIEGYQNVRVGQLATVTISPALVPDLRLILAELMENATAFSPPGTPVEIEAVLDETCRISIIDRGIGMSDDRLAEENRRLVERERLDVVPTSVLGLFVVGRLARRHGLNVELSYTGEQGVTATVVVPADLFTDPNEMSPMLGEAVPSLLPVATRQAPSKPPIVPLAVPVEEPVFAEVSSEPLVEEPVFAEVSPEPLVEEPAPVEPSAELAAAVEPPEENLAWFVPPPSIPEATPRVPGSSPPDGPSVPPAAPLLPVVPLPSVVERPAVPPTGPSENRQPRSPRHAEPEAAGPIALRGLTRRKPGGHLPSFGIGSDDFKTGPVARDAVAERAELEAFTMGTAQAAAARLKKAGSDLVEPIFETKSPMPASQVDRLSTVVERAHPAVADPAHKRQVRSERARPAHSHSQASPVDPSGATDSGGDSSRRARSGLTRRTPGSHLSEYLRSAAEPRPVSTTPSNRDADAERAALDSFLDGLARASTTPDQ